MNLAQMPCHTHFYTHSHTGSPPSSLMSVNPLHLAFLCPLSPCRSSPCLSIDPSLSSRKPGPRFSPPPISSLHHLLPLLPPHCYRSARVFNKVESRLWLMQCWAGGALHETRVSPFSPNGSNQALIDPGLAHQGPLLSSHSSHLSLILPSHK